MANTYISSVFEATKIATDSSDYPEFLPRKYPQVSCVMNTTRGNQWSKSPIIPISHENHQKGVGIQAYHKILMIRNTSNQKTTATPRKEEYHLIPTLPLAPPKSLLCYQPPAFIPDTAGRSAHPSTHGRKSVAK